MPKGLYTEWELAHGKDGHSPDELRYLDMTDGEFERHGAELRAAHAQTTHELEMLKAEGLHEINNLRFAEEIIAQAKLIQSQNSEAHYKFPDIIEGIVAPHREAYLASFESKAPVAKHRIGINEAAFNTLLGETNE